MQKTKLGIGVGLMGAIICLTGYYGGILALTVLGGYIFFKEDDAWLKKLCVRVLVTVLAFYLVNTALSLIPDVLGLLVEFFGWIGVTLKTSFINSFIYFVQDIVGLLQKLVFLGLGLKALKQQTIKIPVIDSLVDKHMA